MSNGRRLVHVLTLQQRCLKVQLQPLSPEASCQFVAAILGVDSVPQALVDLLARRSGGSPLLCQAIARTLEEQRYLDVDEAARTCSIAQSATTEDWEAIATNAIVAASHSVLCVRLAALEMKQQIVRSVHSKKTA